VSSVPILRPQVPPKLRCYGSEEIPEIWDICAPLIQKALDRGSNYTLTDIFYGLCRKEMQLWMWDHDAALVTSIQSKAGKTFCLLLTLAGKDMSLWIQYLPLVEDWARESGAEMMLVDGRIGWSKVIGYDIEFTRMVKQL
jgi:hypothetical protein